jgi:hypothetical protein
MACPEPRGLPTSRWLWEESSWSLGDLRLGGRSCCSSPSSATEPRR